jgi:hypothetical protein
MRADRALIAATAGVVLAEAVTFAVDRRHLAVVTGILLAVIVLGCAAALPGDRAPRRPAPAEDPLWERALARRRSRATALLLYADGSRADWDKHIRPMLAREFQRYCGGPAAAAGHGPALLGPQLWPWVDPDATDVTAHDRPGPGAATLTAIIERMSAP